MKPPHVTVIPLTRGFYASLTSDAERRIDRASQKVDATTEREAVNALAIELITIGGEILAALARAHAAPVRQTASPECETKDQ